jgi:hypothetical protein
MKIETWQENGKSGYNSKKNCRFYFYADVGVENLKLGLLTSDLNLEWLVLQSISKPPVTG